MNKVELHNKALSVINDNYNIKFQADCRQFDLQNFDFLLENLKKLNINHYGPNDKILLVHMETDYYDPLLKYGIIPINILRVFKELDIPFHALLFVTNHFGITKEFDNLLCNHHVKDRPVIIQTLLSDMLISENYDVEDRCIDADKIVKQGLCMMSKQRSHRVFLYNFIKDQNLLDKIATSQRFT